MSVESTPWTLDDHKAELQFGPIVGQVDIAQPHNGLQLRMIGTDDFAATLFGIAGIDDKSWRARDRYVRQPDAIVAYEVDRSDEVSRTIYWRCETISIQGASCHQVSCLISLDTQELDTHPSDSLVSTLPAAAVSVELSGDGENWSMVSAAVEPILFPRDESDAGLLLLKSSESDWSLAFAIHPSDLDCVAIRVYDENAQINITHDLVRPRLEKGVIRRFRAAAICLPRENDEELASAWYSRFADAAPPLTT